MSFKFVKYNNFTNFYVALSWLNFNFDLLVFWELKSCQQFLTFIHFWRSKLLKKIQIVSVLLDISWPFKVKTHKDTSNCVSNKIKISTEDSNTLHGWLWPWVNSASDEGMREGTICAPVVPNWQNPFLDFLL